jgi:hypothetical protein
MKMDVGTHPWAKGESWPHVEQTGESLAVLKAPEVADQLAEEVCTQLPGN